MKRGRWPWRRACRRGGGDGRAVVVEPVAAASGEGPVGGLDNVAGPGLTVPMVDGDEVVGVIDLPGVAGAALGAAKGDALPLLEALATHAAVAIANARLHAETECRSVTDALTQLPNRRRLDADLAAECERAHRFGRPLSVVMVDVDHFKAFNDCYGHTEGDRVLRLVAAALAAGVRDVDTVYRYGGEEFCAIVRESDAQSTATLADRLRLLVKAKSAEELDDVGVTASFGVAEAANR